MALVQGMYFKLPVEVPDETAKYSTRPGQVTLSRCGKASFQYPFQKSS